MKNWIGLAILTFIFPTTLYADHELDGRDIANGEALYAEQCASCHGVNLEGDPNWQTPDENGIYPAPPHDENGHTWHHDNMILFNHTKLGGAEALRLYGIEDFKSGMPPFSDVLTDDEIWDILAYIRSTWPEEIQELHATRNPPH